MVHCCTRLEEVKGTGTSIVAGSSNVDPSSAANAKAAVVVVVVAVVVARELQKGSSIASGSESWMMLKDTSTRIVNMPVNVAVLVVVLL